MTASEKFCLKWNNFQKNISNSFKEIREDFCNVTLMSEDHTKIEAHKVILAGSSSFFRELLKQSQHPHPLLYLGGVKGFYLSAVVDFMYLGEVNIAQEDLDNFLKAAEELKLKGLTGSQEWNASPKVEFEHGQQTKTRNHSVLQSPGNFDQNHYLYQDHINIINEETKLDIEHCTEMSQYNATETKTTSNYDQLDETINTMMYKVDGDWSCIKCDKKLKYKTKMIDHIEGIHIEGVTHPCNQCGKLFRSRNSLRKHISVNHKQY